MRPPATARPARAGVAAAILAAVLAAACASPGIPPGGPPDKEPPALLGVSPDTGALNVRARSVVFRFDEVVNERSTPLGGSQASGALGSLGGSGASTLAQLVMVSPGDGRERVTWRRTGIEIEPRGGFRPNTTYRVTLLPGLSDLRGNVLREAVELVFSTGAVRDTGVIAGVIFDWQGGKAAPLARIEAVSAADSLQRWTTRADSAGRFAVRDLPRGAYRLRGWVDQDNDRAIDPRELLDSLPVTLAGRQEVELYAFLRDTIGPRIEGIEPVDSTALRLRLDRGVAVSWMPEATTLLLQRADSSVVPLRLMMPAARFDSLRAAARAAADSARRAAGDTTVAPPDTAAALAGGRPAGARPPRPGAPLDSTAPKPPELKRPVPITAWAVEAEQPLAPGEYRLTVRGVPGLTGASRASERVFRIRPPAPPADSAAAPGRRPAPVRPPQPARP